MARWSGWVAAVLVLAASSEVRAGEQRDLGGPGRATGLLVPELDARDTAFVWTWSFLTRGVTTLVAVTLSTVLVTRFGVDGSSMALATVSGAVLMPLVSAASVALVGRLMSERGIRSEFLPAWGLSALIGAGLFTVLFPLVTVASGVTLVGAAVGAVLLPAIDLALVGAHARP